MTDVGAEAGPVGIQDIEARCDLIGGVHLSRDFWVWASMAVYSYVFTVCIAHFHWMFGPAHVCSASAGRSGSHEAQKVMQPSSPRPSVGQIDRWSGGIGEL